MNRAAAALIAASILVASPSARGDDSSGADSSPIGEAQQSIREVRYDEAAGILDRALGAGGLDAAATAEAHRLAGEVRAALGQVDVARDHFVRFLVLRPDGALTPGASPKIVEPFEAARARAAEIGALRVDARSARNGDTVRFELIVETDPLRMVAGMKVLYRQGDDPYQHQARLPVSLVGEITAPADVSITAVVAAVDERGNELARVSLRQPASVQAGAVAEVTAAQSQRRPLYEQWYSWTALAVLGAGAGGYFAWRLDQTSDELEQITSASNQHQFSEARDLERRGDRAALLANIGFGTAAVATAVAVVFAARGSYERAPAQTIAPVASGSGAGVVARWSF